MANFRDNPEYINRKGRPKKGKSVTDILLKYGKKRIIERNGKKVSSIDILVEEMWSLALSGDINAMKYIIDRIDGKATVFVQQKTDMDLTYNVVKDDIEKKENDKG